MEDSRKFTMQDHLLGACQQAEVGMDWQDRFTKTDAWNGQCSADQVGQSKQFAEQPPSQALEEDQTPDMSVEGYEREISAYHLDPATYRARVAPGIVKAVLDEERRRRQEARDKEEAAKLRPVELLTTAELEALLLPIRRSIQENAAIDFVPTIKRGLAHIIATYVPKQQQEQATQDAGHVVKYVENTLKTSSPHNQ